VAGINVLVNGPIIVGIPVLADVRLEGAASFGVVMAAFGGGAFIGTILAGVLRKPSPRWLGSLLLIIISWLGIAMALFGFSTSTMIASVLVLSMGIANGYVVILFITWLQSRIPQDMLGRIMSLLMFASVGLNPVSTALAGALIKVDMTGLFVGAGILMTVITLSFLLIPEVRGLGLETPNGRPIGVETAMRRTGELPALGSVLSTGEVPAVRTTDETGIVE
jgi:predicted MFS family arabinose efflux permease